MFPLQLADKGLSKEVLPSTLELVKTGWLMEAPQYSYHWVDLHTYSQHNLTKVLIGRLYSTIDCNFQEKGSRPPL